MTERELFISWLNDAYSTELAMIPVLENHANDARDYPQIYQRNQQHLEETRRQAERLETLITNLGGKVSTAKSITGKALGLGKSVSTGMFSDELIKNFLADYAAEHLEIASYKSLIATAQHLGEDQCVPVLEEILAEEESMAAWLKQHIPMATVESIKFAANDANAKNPKKSKGAKSMAAGLLKPTGLVTLLGVGAVAAGAAMILRSPANKNDQNTNEESPSNLSLETGDGIGNSLANGSDDSETTTVIVSETLIVEDEPELVITRASGGGESH